MIFLRCQHILLFSVWIPLLQLFIGWRLRVNTREIDCIATRRAIRHAHTATDTSRTLRNHITVRCSNASHCRPQLSGFKIDIRPHRTVLPRTPPLVVWQQTCRLLPLLLVMPYYASVRCSISSAPSTATKVQNQTTYNSSHVILQSSNAAEPDRISRWYHTGSDDI